jgi:hypothetical protein
MTEVGSGKEEADERVYPRPRAVINYFEEE